MIEVPKFVPKVFLELPKVIYEFESAEEAISYAHENCIQLRSYAGYTCVDCNATHPKMSNFNPWCSIIRRKLNPNRGCNIDEPLFVQYIETRKFHRIKQFGMLRNELGDTVEVRRETQQERIDRYNQRRYEHWINGDNSPERRGLLQIDRDKLDYEQGFTWPYKHRHDKRHLRYYRQLRTTNERRQYDACLVDENSPKIRGRRSKNSLPNSWDDYYRKPKFGWKAKKVRKQWMVNLN